LQPAYLDPALSFEERLHDLLSRMTLAEKVSQMRNASPAIPRLGLPAYDYWSEGLHGVAGNGRATVFPQVIGLAATWDPALLEQVGAAISEEGRAKYHAAMRRQGYSAHMQGLTFWSPNINIFRDPRWGRGQ
jgi:beta-glucosidase